MIEMGENQNEQDYRVEQAKQYFYGKSFDEALKLLINAEPELDGRLLEELYDVMGCCYFFQGFYDKAEECFDKAIMFNIESPDYVISKAACLINIGRQNSAVSLLEKCKQQVAYPSVYYNLSRALQMSEPTKSDIYKQEMKRRAPINPGYQVYRGLEPSFIKSKNQRCILLRQDKRFIEEDLPILKQKGSFSMIFNESQKYFVQRDNATRNTGILLSSFPKYIIQSLNQLSQLYKETNKLPEPQNITFNLQQELLIQQIQQLAVQIIEMPAENDELDDEKADGIKEKIQSIKRKVYTASRRQQLVRNNEQDYIGEIKNLQDIISQGELSNQIKFTLTKQRLIIFISKNYQRSLFPTKLMKAIPVEDQAKKIIFNTYWLVILTILIRNEDSDKPNQIIDRQKLSKFRYVLHHLYRESCEEKKMEQVEINDSITYFDWVFTQTQQFWAKEGFERRFLREPVEKEFLPREKKDCIIGNIKTMGSYIDEIDQRLAEIFNNEQTVNFFMEQSECAQDIFLAQSLNLGLGIKKKITEIYLTFIYHLRKAYRPHQIIYKSFQEILSESQKEFDGRKSMKINFMNSLVPEQEHNISYYLKKMFSD